MARKGNLLYNGDFETGTTEGWINGIFGLNGEMEFSASEEAKYEGNYGGMLRATGSNQQSYVGYNKVCSFEEYEGYLYLIKCKIISGNLMYPVLFGLDDKGSLIKTIRLGRLLYPHYWEKHQVILRGDGEITHFKVGVFAEGASAGDKFYFDEAKLIPLKSIKGHQLSEYFYVNNLTTDFVWLSPLACIGTAKLRSAVRTDKVSGTSPTLDVTIMAVKMENDLCYYELKHTQFTGKDFEELTIDVRNIGYLWVTYDLGGTDPQFDIYHFLSLEPY